MPSPLTRHARGLSVALAITVVLSSCALPPAPPPRGAAVAQPVAEPVVEPTAAPAAEPAAGITDAPLPIDPDVRLGKLDNGLTYYVRANKEPRQRADLWLAVNAGSLQEDEDQKGLAHFLEHMMFNGTSKYPGPALIDYLETIGMRFGPDVNAYTSFDETVYQLQVPTDKPELVSQGLDVLKEWAANVSLDPQEVEKERGVIVEEWRLSEQNASGRLSDKVVGLLLGGSRYAERLPIGDMDVVRNATPETLRRFYQDWYRPDLMAVVAVGDFDPDEMEAQIKERFGELPRPEAPRPRITSELPKRGETSYLVATDKEYPYAVVQLLHRIDSAPVKTERDYADTLVDTLISVMLNNRFREITLAPDAPFTFAGAGTGGLVRDVSTFEAYAQTQEGGTAKGLEALAVELERARRHGFTASELEQARAELLRAYQSLSDSRDSTKSEQFTSEYVNHFLEGTPIPGITREIELGQAALPAITLDQVNARMAELLPNGDRAVIVIAPDKAGLTPPTEAELAAVMTDVEARTIEPYVDGAGVDALMSAPPEPAAIVSERALPDLGATEITLANGVRVLMKPTDFEKDEVLFSASSLGGASLVPDAEYAEAAVAAGIVSQSGVGQLSQNELNELLARKVARVGPYIGELEEGFFGQASPQDLELALQLLHLYATQPQVDPNALKTLQQQARADLANRELDPDAARYDALNALLCGQSIRCNVLPMPEIDAIDLARAEAIYRDRFSDLGDATFTFVGDFDVEQLKQLTQRYLGTLPAGQRKEAWQDAIPDRTELAGEETVRKGAGDIGTAVITFSGPADLDYAGRVRLNALQKLLTIRLREELREARGGTYSPFAQGGWSDRPDPEYSVQAEFSSDPKRLAELVDAADKVFAELRAGTTEANLAKVKEQMLREHELRLRDNNFWSSVLEDAAEVEARAGDRLRFAELASALTLDDLKQAANDFLRDENKIVVTQYPAGTP